MKAKALSKIETIKSKVQDLWGMMPNVNNTQCQTIMRELDSLSRNIEDGHIKFQTSKSKP